MSLGRGTGKGYRRAAGTEMDREREDGLGAPDGVWKRHSGGHGQVPRHTQDRQNSKCKQGRKTWVLWTPWCSQVCEQRGREQPGKDWRRQGALSAQHVSARAVVAFRTVVEPLPSTAKALGSIPDTT